MTILSKTTPATPLSTPPTMDPVGMLLAVTVGGIMSESIVPEAIVVDTDIV